MLEVNKIYCGNALSVLQSFSGESVNCIITSPPYWGLRDYGVDGQLGLESTYQLYIEHLMQVMAECKRVLRKDGTMWVNIGDSYLSSGGASRHFGYQDPKYTNGRAGNFVEPTAYPQGNLQPKSLVGIPERFKLAMIDELGMINRNTIIWHKPNCMPSSAKDRFTVDFEYVYFFTKSGKYWFEQQKEPYSPNTDIWYRKELREGKEYNCKKPYKNNTPYLTAKAQNPSDSKRRILESMKNSKGRNMRCVWDINTKPFKEAHFATFPPELIEPMIKSGCPENGIVLDPFIGSGTVGCVAKLLNRNFVGIELSSKYINEMAIKRISKYAYQERLSI